MPTPRAGVRSTAILVALAAALFARPARAQNVPTGFADSVVTSGLDLPTAFEFLPDGRLLVAEQYSGKVRLIVNGSVSAADPVLTIAGITTTGERGLLGVAIDPQFPARPYFYTHQTVNGTPLRVRISRWTLTGDLANTGNGQLACDAASRYDLISDIPDNAGNHNGGTVRFGSDGMLYVSIGEDADPCAAQEPDSLKGKILRLDTSQLPAGPGAASRAQITPADNPFVADSNPDARLVMVYGLRNPFRFQADLQGGLVIGDVGQDTYEEIDLLATGGGALAGSAAAGSNFGWPWFEGTSAHGSCGGSAPSTVSPVYVFDRSALGSCAIISGGVYRPVTGGSGNWPASYTGSVFFSEYYSGILVRLTRQGSVWAVAPDVAGQPASGKWGNGYTNASDWRVGPDGALWYCRQFTGSFFNSGVIGRIAPTGSVTPPPPPPPALALRFTAHPLPAHDSVTLEYQLASATTVHVRIYDMQGALVRELVPERLETAAVHAVVWDGRDDRGHAVQAGLYWGRLDAGGTRLDRKLTWLR